MHAIYKYPLTITLRQTVQMPKGAKLLHLGEQGGRLMLWALVDTSAPFELVPFAVFGTGWFIRPDELGDHVGTVQMSSGLVWHVFRAVEETREGQ